jgi:hypothetical protein
MGGKNNSSARAELGAIRSGKMNLNVFMDILHPHTGFKRRQGVLHFRRLAHLHDWTNRNNLAPVKSSF